ncbi:MAG: NAD(P)-dependent oxidoreductase [Ancrocorticia sp.]
MTDGALKVGVIGTGIMGAPMAANMAAAGWPVSGWARRREAAEAVPGITAVADVRELASCDVLVSVLPDLPQLEDVLSGGLLEALGERGSCGEDSEGGDPGERETAVTLVICSTSSPTGVRELAERLAEAGIAVVDAPISGGQKKAVEGTLAIMVGGADTDVARVLPILRACGTPVHLGPLGSGQVAKACNQMIVSATVAALAEATVLAERSGLDVAALFELLSGGLAGSEVLNQKAPKLIAHDHTVSGPAKYFIKDLGFTLEQADSAGVRLDLAHHLRETWAAMTEAGYGDLDTTALQAYIEDRS